jgi:UDP-N-acetylglucosamine diphosphorylase / glucose-1-phosphate thymidylyltransferase / UDP-N-acetylgalactosamine diphosphorylase / glucosamine-1-phosphate N-acetyltransferase / galactosamine-1-phosphate N-acetyltransferase
LKAVVLAAGRGERLWPLTEDTPKPLLPLANKSVIERICVSLVSAGIPQIILVVGFRSEKIRDRLGKGKAIGAELNYVKQKTAKGTADALGTCSTELRGEERFLVLYGDDYYDSSVPRTFLAKARTNKGITIGSANVKDASRFGKIQSNLGLVTEIQEKTSKAEPGQVNAGIYLMDQSVFPAVRKTKRSIRGELELTDAVRILIKEGTQVHTHPLGSRRWLGISYPWDMLEANQWILESEKSVSKGTIERGVHLSGSVVLEEGSVVKAGSYLEGPVHVGKRCHVGPNSYLRPYSTLGDDVKVGAGCEVKNSIVMRNTRIPHLSYVGDCIIGENCSLGAGTITANLRFDEAEVKSKVRGSWVDSGRKKLGAILGDGVRTGINVSTFPGVKVGRGAWIGPGAIVDRDVPSNARYKAS